MIKLIACDLDNTLLDENKTLSDETVLLLRECTRRGIFFAIASGRLYGSALEFAKQISSETNIISYNGAYVADASGHVLQQAFLPVELIKELIGFAKDLDLNIQLYNDGKIVLERRFYQLYPRKGYSADRLIIVDDLNRYEILPSPKALIFSSPEKAQLLCAEIRRVWSEQIYVTMSDSTSIEIMPPGINKGNALSVLAKHLGVDMSQVMAIGDNENDFEMIHAAGVGVAVANSSGGLKKLADYVCKEPNSGGVREAIRKFCF